MCEINQSSNHTCTRSRFKDVRNTAQHYEIADKHVVKLGIVQLCAAQNVLDIRDNFELF